VYADQWDFHTFPEAGLGLMENLNTGSIFEELFAFQRWAGNSQGQKLYEYNWESDRTITKILKSPLDARQWPVVGALVILQGLASNLHFHELPFFEKNENTSRCRRQSWLKSASALCKILANPYWERAWILQEIILAQSPILYYGPHMMPFQLITKAQWFFEKHSTGCCRNHIYDSASSEFTFYKTWWGKIKDAFTRLTRVGEMWNIASQGRKDQPGSIPKFELGDLLMSGNGKRKATDPRDLVYAVLGLLDDDAQLAKIEADYSVTTGEVFARATARIMQHDKGFDILSWPHWRESLVLGIPSWSPDWSHDIVSGHKSTTQGEYRLFRASLDLKSNGELQSDLCLSVRSYKVDSIDRASQISHICVSSSLNDVHRHLLKWHALALSAMEKNNRFNRIQETGNLDRKRKEEFLRTLLGDCVFPEGPIDFHTITGLGRRIAGGDISHIIGWWNWFMAMPNADAKNEYRQWEENGKIHQSIHARCIAFTSHKRFFVTKEGRFGLGPCSHAEEGLVVWPTALEGDEIHVLKGCNMPVLLRRLDNLSKKSPRQVSDRPENNKGKALMKKLDESSGMGMKDVDDLDLRTKSSGFSASLDKCSHNKERVYQCLGPCYVHGLQDGEALQNPKVNISTIFVR
jgi:hypothetical protein